MRILLAFLISTTAVAKSHAIQEPNHHDYECIRHQCEWTQWGNEVAGTQNGENFGVSVSLSRSGYVLAVGAERHNHRGRVQVYYYNRNLAEWEQRGDDLSGEEESGEEEWFGTSVDLSSDGNRLVVGDWKQPGSVKVFDWDGYQWVQLGSTLTGSTWYHLFGDEVRISGDGKRIIVGNASWGERQTGQVLVYELVDNDWAQVGQSIDGRTAQDMFGLAIDINEDGNFIAIGGPFNERNGKDAGHVRVYELVDGKWKPKGSDMEGSEPGDNFGYAVALSGDGMTIAVGARERLDSPGGRRQGYLEVFEFDNDADEWLPLGDKVHGSDNDAQFGSTVAISKNGSRVIGGTPYYNGQYASVFHVSESGLIQIGDDLEGDFDFGAPFGRSAAMDTSGEIVAVGAAQRRGVTSDSYSPGYVRVYRCT